MRYRVEQFWQVLIARPLTEAAWLDVKAVLSQAEVVLFAQFTNSDQWHSVRVVHTLQAKGHDEPALLKAALLHDIGKTKMNLTIGERVAVVLAEKMAPNRAANWGEGEAKRWRRPFVVKAKHPEWGAQMAAAAGSDTLTTNLIRRHQEHLHGTAVTKEDKMLQALQWADNQN